MGEVTGFTAERTLEIENTSVIDGNINESGHLILVQRDGTEIDTGSALATIPDASVTQKGILELATNAETITGTDTTRAITPASLTAAVGTFDTRLDALEAGGAEYTLTSNLTDGKWYRIASFTTAVGVSAAKASADITITTDGPGQSNILRFRVTASFNVKSNLSIEEYAGTGATQFTKARIIALNGNDNGHAVEVYHASSVSGSRYKLVVKNDDWIMPSSYPQTRWGNLGFVLSSEALTSPEAVAHLRGIGHTGSWTYPTLTNSWVIFGTDHESPAYKMGPGGFVDFKGVMKDGLINTLTGFCFTLPEGCRPSLRSVFGVSANGGIGRVDVLVDGRVLVHNGSTTQMSLHGIRFLATQ